MFADPVACAAQEETRDARVTMLADDDQANALALGVTDNGIGGMRKYRGDQHCSDQGMTEKFQDILSLS